MLRHRGTQLLFLAFTGLVFQTSASADSQTFSGSVPPGQALSFMVTTDVTGPINYTLTWVEGTPLVSCIYAPTSIDPDACGAGPSPLAVADNTIAPGTFTVTVSLPDGNPETAFTLVVNYPTSTTPAALGPETRDDLSLPPNKWIFQPADAPTPAFEVLGGDTGFVDYSLDGGQTFIAVQATYVINDGLYDRVTAAIPAQPLDAAVAYRTRAVAPDGSEARRTGSVIYFVTDLPVSLAEIADNPPFYRGGSGWPSPDTWRDQSVYMLIPDRFYNADPANDRLGFSNFDLTHGGTMHGGDWAGVTSRLDYLAQLGVTALWVTPSPQNWIAYHGYAAVDLLLPARQLGTLQDFRDMVDAAHARGIYVLLDITCNHQADLIYNDTPDDVFNYPDGYPTEFYYIGRPSSGKPLPYPLEFRDKTLFHPYGRIDNFDDQGANPSHAELGELSRLDDFRTENPDVRAALLKIFKWWMANTDIDGFRLDAVKHVELPFWRAFSTEIKRYARNTLGKDNFFLTGEFLSGDDWRMAGYTGENVLNSLLYYPMYFTVQDVFKNSRETKLIDDRYAANGVYYSPDLLLTFLDDHDQSRFLNNAGPNGANRLKAALGFLYTARGIPTLYYGTEQGFDGNRNSGCTGGDCNREDMFANPAWDANRNRPGDSFDTTSDLFQYISLLNQIRAANLPLRRGSQMQRWRTTSGPGFYVYTRTAGNEEVLIVLNTSGQTQTAAPQVTTAIIPPGTTLTDQLSGSTVMTYDGGSGITRVPISVGPYGVQIFKP